MQREYKLVSEKVGIIDLTPFAKINVSGPDARPYLDYLLAGTVPKIGRTSLAHALTIGKRHAYKKWDHLMLNTGFFQDAPCIFEDQSKS